MWSSKTLPETFHYDESEPYGSETYISLIDAVIFGDVRAARSLLAVGADVNGRDKFGRAALSWAVWRENMGIALLLIGQGADIHSVDDSGRTALSLAAEK